MRTLILGNRGLTVLLDKEVKIRDFFYPHVGQENHIDEQGYKLGIWIDSTLHWIDSSWKAEFSENNGIGSINLTHPSVALALQIQCAVCHNKNIFIQKISVQNTSQENKDIRIFINHHLRISGNDIGNTVYYHPKEKCIIFYKGNRYFLISGAGKKPTFDDYAVGTAHFKEWEGTYRDAEDGILSKNPIQHGSVDATIAFHLQGQEQQTLYHYIICGKRFQEVVEEKKYILKRTPEKLLQDTELYWKIWSKKLRKKFHFLPENVQALYLTSLRILALHSDSYYGGIIASLDSDILTFNKDTYTYVWPRDAAFISYALDLAGEHNISEKFFSFAEKIVTKDGYMLQKYNPDHSLGSSWHPWSKHGILRLPIQEDETALVIYALEKFIQTTNRKDLLKKFYHSLIKPASNFMVNFRDKTTKLPEESYNLWEEKFGIHTFTTCTIYAALKSAAKMAKLLKKREWKKYEKAAEEIKEASFQTLCDPEKKVCIKRIHKKDNEYVPYEELDTSTLYALFNFDLISINDPLIKNLAQQVEEKLTTPLGGIARYQNDLYMKIPNKDYPGNPWIITTMWLAQCYIQIAQTKDEMKKAESLILWAADRALPTGVLAEQYDPYTGDPLSACPLAWSHASFIETVLKFENKMKELNE